MPLTRFDMRRPSERKPHLTMTPEEYAALHIIGWHEVCKNVDGCGGIGIRYLGQPLPKETADAT